MAGLARTAGFSLSLIIAGLGLGIGAGLPFEAIRVEALAVAAMLFVLTIIYAIVLLTGIKFDVGLRLSLGTGPGDELHGTPAEQESIAYNLAALRRLELFHMVASLVLVLALATSFLTALELLL